jgi:hypothetical protein
MRHSLLLMTAVLGLLVGPALAADEKPVVQDWGAGRSVTDRNGDFLYVRPDPQTGEVVEAIIANRPATRIEPGENADTVIFAEGGPTFRFSGNTGAIVLDYGQGGRFQQRGGNIPDGVGDPIDTFIKQTRKRAITLRHFLKRNNWPHPKSPPIDGEAPGKAAVQDGAGEKPQVNAQDTEDFIRSAMRGRTQKVAAYLDAGVDINAANEHGHTALYSAIRGGEPAVVKLLLKRGADPDRKVRERPMLYHAIRYDRPAIVKLLLKRGADPDRKVRERPMLYHAVRYERRAIVKALLKHGADPNTTVRGEPLLFYAVGRDGSIAGLLINAGANVNATNDRGETALIKAAIESPSSKKAMRSLSAVGQHERTPKEVQTRRA